MSKWIEHPGPGRRCAMLRISDYALLESLKPKRGEEFVSDPVPDDARVIGIDWDPFTSTIKIVLSSEQFDTTEEGSTFPEIRPVIAKIEESTVAPLPGVPREGERILHHSV